MVRIYDDEDLSVTRTVVSCDSRYYGQYTNVQSSLYFTCHQYTKPAQSQKKNPFTKIAEIQEPIKIGNTRPAIKLSTTFRIRANL